MAFEHGEMLEQCSQSQTFFVIQFAEEARASSEERKSNYHLVQVAIFMSAGKPHFSTTKKMHREKKTSQQKPKKAHCDKKKNRRQQSVSERLRL